VDASGVETKGAAGMLDMAGVPEVELEVLVTADLPMPQGYVFRPGDGNRAKQIAGLFLGDRSTIHGHCLAFVVRHPEAGTILIDTGMHPDARRSLRRDFGLPMSVLFRGLRPAPQPFDQQLGTIGIDPAAVRQVVMTHLHVDHTSGMRLLPGAEFLCSSDEWRAARGRNAVRQGYVAHHLPPESRMRLLDVQEGEPFGPFKKTIDLLGDSSIRLVSTPGHTKGHMAVLLRASGKPVFVVGDAAYTVRSIDDEILPLLTLDDESYLDSMRQLKAFARSVPEALLVPSHDPSAWQQLRRASR
jgi:N-acyl homoserine lactone hydrolase